MKTSKLLFSFLLFFIAGCFTAASAQDSADQDFDSFLKKFTSSAEFQYYRVSFALETRIVLTREDGTEQEMPFTMAEWPLLTADELKEFRKEEPDGIIFGRFTVKKTDHVEYESGLEESELDLSIVFDRVDGKWYVTDCYNGWYGSVSPEDIEAVVYDVQQKNQEFEKKHP